MPWFAVAVVVVMLGLGAAAVLLSGSPPTSGAVFRPVSVTGSALPPAGEGADSPVGLRAPEVAGADFDGEAIAIRSDGRPKVVVLLAHWCPHCQVDVRTYAELLNERGLPAGVDLYSISTWVDAGRPNFPPDSWLRRENWPVQVLVDDERSSAAAAFGLVSTPLWVFIDAEGKVVARFSGELPVARFDAMLGRLAAA